MLSNLLSNSMKHGALDRFSPISARRFYNSVCETFRAETHKTNGRRLFRARPVLDTGGIRLIPEAVPTGADAAGAADARQV